MEHGPQPTETGASSRKPLSRRRAFSRNLSVQLPSTNPSNMASTFTSLSPHSLNHQDDGITIKIEDLVLHNRLGSGNGGTVYRVSHNTIGRQFTLKVIRCNFDEHVQVQIRRELEILRAVRHPNVVRCHEIFQYHREIKVLLEFLDERSFIGIHIKDEARLRDVARQILCGLEYVHSQNIVHRDIKPSNLLTDSQQNVKIADFGVSKLLEQTMDLCNSTVGTVAYLSPERINPELDNGNYDGAAGDIWSFGVCMLELYLGWHPYTVGEREKWLSYFIGICTTQPPEVPFEASIEFWHFIKSCLHKDYRKRWSAESLLKHAFITRRSKDEHLKHSQRE